MILIAYNSEINCDIFKISYSSPDTFRMFMNIEYFI